MYRDPAEVLKDYGDILQVSQSGNMFMIDAMAAVNLEFVNSCA